MREWLSGNLLIFLAFERLVLLSSQFCGTSVTVLGGYCFFLWPTFLFTHVTKRDSGHTNVSPSVQRNILPLTCQNNVTPRWGTEKLQIGFFFFFPHCAFHLFPQQPLSLPILHILLSWMEPSPDAHCRSDHELLSSGYSKLEEGWENSYEGPHNSTHSRNRQLKIKENAFSLAICFGRWKLVSIIPNASWSTVLQLVETGHCWNNKDVVMWDKAAVKSLLSSEKDPSRAAKALWVQK